VGGVLGERGGDGRFQGRRAVDSSSVSRPRMSTHEVHAALGGAQESGFALGARPSGRSRIWSFGS
jgi:hypothetical protein